MVKQQQNYAQTTPDFGTDFGFERVHPRDKDRLVAAIFSKVADKYDVMNDVMSAGVHRLWKARLIQRLYLSRHFSARAQPLHLLDLAGGTGDIAFRAAKHAQKLGCPLKLQVLDINPAMLHIGAQRSRQQGCASQQSGNFTFTAASAEALPLADSSVDFITIAFGIRNVTHRAQALREAWRVLKPGGRFVCLEFSHLSSPFMQKLYDAYSFHIIPPLGAAIAGQRAAYQYLVESIRNFPRAEIFAAELEAAGFARVRCEILSGGIAALHGGWRV